MKETKNEYSKNLKGLSVYEKSLRIVREIYETLNESFDIVLFENIRETACKITINLAESHATKYYGKEFSHLNEMIGSINRIRAMLDVASLRGFLPLEVSRQLTFKAVELLRMTIGLVKKNRKANSIYGKNIGVEEFSNSPLYKRSIELSQSIYMLVDDANYEISDKDWKRAYEIAVEVPSLIASGIGQLNMTIRLRNFNKAKNNLKDLENLLNQFRHLPPKLIECLNDIVDLRIQVLKLLNAYFGSLKSSNKVEQIQ